MSRPTSQAKNKPTLTLARILSVTTGLLLMPVAYLAALSGICIRLPGAIEDLTLGLLEGYAECHRLHLEALPLLLTPLLVIHVIASLELALTLVENQGKIYKALAMTVRGIAWLLGGILLAATLLYYK